jgi:hypothetical protein
VGANDPIGRRHFPDLRMVSRELGEAVATPRCGTQAATVRREDGFAVANLGSRRFARHGLASCDSLETFER